jgi:hypothetical protein
MDSSTAGLADMGSMPVSMQQPSGGGGSADGTGPDAGGGEGSGGAGAALLSTSTALVSQQEVRAAFNFDARDALRGKMMRLHAAHTIAMELVVGACARRATAGILAKWAETAQAQVAGVGMTLATSPSSSSLKLGVGLSLASLGGFHGFLSFLALTFELERGDMTEQDGGGGRGVGGGFCNSACTNTLPVIRQLISSAMLLPAYAAASDDSSSSAGAKPVPSFDRYISIGMGVGREAVGAGHGQQQHYDGDGDGDDDGQSDARVLVEKLAHFSTTQLEMLCQQAAWSQQKQKQQNRAKVRAKPRPPSRRTLRKGSVGRVVKKAGGSGSTSNGNGRGYGKAGAASGSPQLALASWVMHLLLEAHTQSHAPPGSPCMVRQELLQHLISCCVNSD